MDFIINLVLSNAMIFIALITYWVIRAVIFVGRQVAAQRQVNRALSRLTMWRNRAEDGYSFYEYDVNTKSMIEWEHEVMEDLIEKYSVKFNAAVENRDSIRF